jgi:hypothetical protein
MKRLLDCVASDFRGMTGKQLKQAIKASEGRNFFDVFQPAVQGLQVNDPRTVIHTLKSYTGRPIGLNLEPVDPRAKQVEQLVELPAGRMASAETFAEAKKLGFDFVSITGNPKTGVTNAEISRAIQQARSVIGDDVLIIAGKMHGAGVADEAGSDIVGEQAILQFIKAGADMILLPSPGTVPGTTLDSAKQMVDLMRKHGALSILATGTSQEGSDEDTIRQIALYSKMAGADLYHIGDAGYSGIAVPENIMHYSIVIRGKRHTYVRMATSVLR